MITNFLKKTFFIALFTIIIVMVLLEAFAPWSIKHEKELSKIFDSIAIMENSEMIEYRKVRKAFSASIFADYKTSAGKESIREYYYDELAKERWTFVEEKVYKYKSKKHIMHELIFKKNNYGVIITFYTSENEVDSIIDGKNWDYKIALFWN